MKNTNTNSSTWPRIIVSTMTVVTAGSILHFAWEWTGRRPLVAVLAATNESTWEHMKLAFWPALFLAPIQYRFYGRPPGWLLATTFRCLLSPVLIVVVFYSYTAVLGTNYLILDITTFIVAVLSAEIVGHTVMLKRVAVGLRVGAALVLLIATLAFQLSRLHHPNGFYSKNL